MVETIVLTASAGTFPDLASALGNIPVTVEEHPLISFEGPPSWSKVDAALAEAASYESMVFTSPRAAQVIAERIGARESRDGPLPPQLWAVGAATARPLQSLTRSVTIPDTPRYPASSPAAALAAAMLETGARGPVLFFCGEKHRDDLPAILRANGVQVDEVVCYRSVLASRSQALAAAARGSILVVTSPSVVDLLVAACRGSDRPHLIAIGATTAASARAAAWIPAAIAPEPSTRGLAAAIATLLPRINS
jgi:uroporphyrinogen-III synthase